MKTTLLLLLLSSSTWAACPLFTFPENHKLDQEINNVCDNILNPTINYETVTKGVFTSLAVSTLTAVSSGTITNLTVTNFTGSLTGTTTNDNAAAGKVGEYISAVTGTISFASSNVGEDGTSIVLTAGDWEVTGGIRFTQNGAAWTQQLLYVANGLAGNNFTGSLPGVTTSLTGNASSTTNPTDVMGWVPKLRISLSASATIYLKVRAVYSSGTPLYEGGIFARRVR